MIQLLSEDTIQKIAAGEVIERPASVIKELVENSIDAKSTEIIVEIEDGGKSLIKVSDNGLGIKESEIEKAFLRHSTSKIVDFKDIYNITSLGFRGEALASIISISKLKINTKTMDDKLGVSAYYENGKQIRKKPIAMNKGTTMEIRDIFYNVPVRKKFMKKNITEANIITNLMYKFAIGNSDIGFKYIKDDKVIFETYSNSTLSESIMELFAIDHSKDLHEINIKEKNFSIKGYVSNNKYYRANRNMQYIYINGRYIEDVDIRKSIENIYKSIIPNGRFPVFQLFLEMDPAYIDVNVHPNKKLVKITILDELILKLIEEIKFNLNKNTYLPEIEKQIKKESTLFNSNKYDYKDLLEKSFGNKDNKELVNLNNIKKENLLFDIDEDFEIKKINDDRISLNEYEDMDIIEENISFIDNREDHVKEETSGYLEEDITKDNSNNIKNDFANYISNSRYIGIIFKNYIVFESYENSKIYLIDQHAAHERILYEKFMNDFKNEEILSQDLIAPIFLEINTMEMELFNRNIEEFNKLGFTIEEFGKNTLVIRSIPIILGNYKNQQLVLDILDTLESNENIPDIEDKIIKKACKNAVKSGDNIGDIEVEGLIENLLNTKYPYTCPHGRPTVLELTKYELEKMFLRVK